MVAVIGAVIGSDFGSGKAVVVVDRVVVVVVVVVVVAVVVVVVVVVVGAGWGEGEHNMGLSMSPREASDAHTLTLLAPLS